MNKRYAIRDNDTGLWLEGCHDRNGKVSWTRKTSEAMTGSEGYMQSLLVCIEPQKSNYELVRM